MPRESEKILFSRTCVLLLTNVIHSITLKMVCGANREGETESEYHQHLQRRGAGERQENLIG